MKRLSKYLDFHPHILLLFLISTLYLACKEVDKTEESIAKIPIDLTISRFDREFARAEPDGISLLKSKYPYLFPSQFPDSIWVAKLTDTIQLELSQEVDKAFGDFTEQSTDLESLFRHITYYFPKFNIPKVVTVTSDVRYNDRIILTDTLLLVGLDNYLGAQHHFYEGIQRYIAAGLDEKYLTSDVASAFAKKVLKYPRNRTFLSRMVHYGKELYLKDKLLPQITDAQKIGYTDEEIQWARENEEQMWRYFVENELLYSTKSELDRRFLDPAPFSKFRLELDSESPGRVGRYIGWQIVRAFMDKNDITLQQLLGLPADEIFNKSKYKPRK
ncbi:gliding motility lipoprotein GldB [Flagellimonas sp. S3867]|uniref:gliding motility lipoprotein GldB n=1 Tax=Flagellimonas sp. S3867 TaxID=2768063 RepID=UPI001682B87A|nr:gliding motility lipoprotein GldB [Flagellimonas sp. S3867]